MQVLQCEPLEIKILNSSIEICRIFGESLQPDPPTQLYSSIEVIMIFCLLYLSIISFGINKQFETYYKLLVFLAMYPGTGLLQSGEHFVTSNRALFERST